jgi:hypothetical protein
MMCGHQRTSDTLAEKRTEHCQTYLGLSLAVFLTVYLGAYGVMQPWHGHQGYCGAGRRVWQYRRINFVFGLCLPSQDDSRE